MSIFDVKISGVKRANHRQPVKDVLLSTWLKTTQYYDRQKQVAKETDDKKRKDLKLRLLPAVAISGQFSYISEKNFIRHSGFICIDIDGKDNTHLGNFDELKEICTGIPEVAYCGLSASGNGYFLLFRVPKETDAETHKRHFWAIHSAFKNMGVEIDTAPQNVSALRYYSHDPNAYFNESAPVFTHMAELEAKQETPSPLSLPKTSREYKPLDSDGLPVLNNGRLDTFTVLLNKIKENRTDITSGNNGVPGWKVWANIARAIAGEYGESGRQAFYDVSGFYSGYEKKEAESQYSDALKDKRTIDISYFFKVCASYGLNFADEMKQHKENLHKKHLDREQQAEYIDPETGEILSTQPKVHTDGYNPYTDEVFDERGYPAAWDEVTEPKPGTAEHSEMLKAELEAGAISDFEYVQQADPKAAKIISLFDAVPE